MKENNRTDMQKMQRDAEQRIREMQRKADRAVSGSDMPPVPNFVRVDNRQRQSQRQTQHEHEAGHTNKNQNRPEHLQEPPKPEIKEAGSNKGLNLLKMLNFDKLKIDKDVMLIVVMILLLSSEETDELLLMALVYIML